MVKPSSDYNNKDVVSAFSNIVNELAVRSGPATVRTMSFWCGAGFAKAWAPQSPTEGTLFSISRERIEKFRNLSHVLNALGWGDNDGIGFEGFKTLRYVLSMQLPYPDIRNRFLDDPNLAPSVDELRTFVQQRFEELCELNYVDLENNRFSLPKNLNQDQAAILAFFRHLSTAESTGFGSGLGALYHYITTNYDFTIETILDNIDELKAPIINRLYRGVSPEYICGEPSWNRPAHTFDHNLIKLNGGFEIIDVRDRYHFDYRRRDHADVQERPPILILPSREQDYSDPYFRAIFSKAVRVLRDTQILVIVGYSMPREDALLLFILRQLAESVEDAHGKYIFSIDLKAPDILSKRINWTFSNVQKLGWPKVLHYTGRFEDFCKEVIDQNAVSAPRALSG